MKCLVGVNIIDSIKKFIKQNFICKHESYNVIKKLYKGYSVIYSRKRYTEIRKCIICDKEHCSDDFLEYGNERHYIIRR